MNSIRSSNSKCAIDWCFNLYRRLVRRKRAPILLHLPLCNKTESPRRNARDRQRVKSSHPITNEPCLLALRRANLVLLGLRREWNTAALDDEKSPLASGRKAAAAATDDSRVDWRSTRIAGLWKRERPTGVAPLTRNRNPASVEERAYRRRLNSRTERKARHEKHYGIDSDDQKVF